MVSFSQVLCQDDISFCSNAMLFVLNNIIFLRTTNLV